jgi:hypothetical protein
MVFFSKFTKETTVNSNRTELAFVMCFLRLYGMFNDKLSRNKLSARILRLNFYSRWKRYSTADRTGNKPYTRSLPVFTMFHSHDAEKGIFIRLARQLIATWFI